MTAKSSGGGLIIYHDLPADGPKGWMGARTHDIEEVNRQKWVGRRNITVPYRRNRMVLFDSGRYHRSASYNFKPGYRNRRINLTYLFGPNPRLYEQGSY
jgi:hypothetical protein